MGTSSSSKGPGSGMPMVPPWADDPVSSGDSDKAPPGDQHDGSDGGQGNNEPEVSQDSSVTPPPVAPQGRFTGARSSMRDYAGSGNSDDMRKGVGRYVSKGYGGSSTATRRMGNTISTAGALVGALSSESRSAGNFDGFDAQELQGKSASEIMDAVVEAVRPIDGTQDTEASRESIKDALSELLDHRPDVDLLELDLDARFYVVEQFLASDVYRRIFLDIGKSIQENAPSALAGLKRLRQIKDYVRETVKSAFKNVKAGKNNITPREISEMSKSVLLDTFRIFEGYAS